MENSAEDAKPKKRARSALRLGPKERAAAAQAVKDEETAAATAKPSSSKRAKPPKAAPPAHEVFVANLPFDVTEERVRAPACSDAVSRSHPLQRPADCSGFSPTEPETSARSKAALSRALWCPGPALLLRWNLAPPLPTQEGSSAAVRAQACSRSGGWSTRTGRESSR